MYCFLNPDMWGTIFTEDLVNPFIDSGTSLMGRFKVDTITTHIEVFAMGNRTRTYLNEIKRTYQTVPRGFREITVMKQLQQ